MAHPLSNFEGQIDKKISDASLPDCVAGYKV